MRGKVVGWYLCDECCHVHESDGFWCPECRAETTLRECETWMLDLSDEEIADFSEKGEL
jgi:hypothetical protein